MQSFLTMLANAWTTLIGVAGAIAYYLANAGPTPPKTKNEWAHFAVGLGIAALGAVSKDATTGSRPKSLLLPLLLPVILLTGCAGQLQDFTVNDLRAAGARAAAGNDPVAAQCYPVLADQIAGQKAPGSVAGVVDLFELGRLATMKAQGGVSSEVKAKCAELSLELLVFLAKLGLKVVAPIPTIGP